MYVTGASIRNQTTGLPVHGAADGRFGPVLGQEGVTGKGFGFIEHM